MTEIEGDYLVADDFFVDAAIGGFGLAAHIYELAGQGKAIHGQYTRAQVREALKPVKGKAYFWVKNTDHNDDAPEYFLIEDDEWDEEIAAATQTLFAVNALTIGKTCGGLRELIAWSEA